MIIFLEGFYSVCLIEQVRTTTDGTLLSCERKWVTNFYKEMAHDCQNQCLEHLMILLHVFCTYAQQKGIYQQECK